MISGVAVLQDSQAVIAQFEFLEHNLPIVTPAHAKMEEHAVYVVCYNHDMHGAFHNMPTDCLDITHKLCVYVTEPAAKWLQL